MLKVKGAIYGGGLLTMRPRPPTEKKGQKPTLPPPLISCGKKEKELLGFLKANPEIRFNKRRYYINHNLPKSTLNDMLARLINKGLVYKPHEYDHKLTDQGKAVLELLNEGVGISRGGGRGRSENLSFHKIKYECQIIDRAGFKESSLRRLKPIKIKENKLPNLEQHILYFDSYTIVVNPRRVYIHLYEIMGDDMGNSQYESFIKALDVFTKLRDIGLNVDGLKMDSGHWSRIESYLSEYLQKIDQNYNLDLGNGHSFFIDMSGDKREDETTDEDFRERLDDTMRSLKGTNSDWRDVDNLRETLAQISQETARINNNISAITEAVKANSLTINTILKIFKPAEPRINPSQDARPEYLG